MYTMFPTPAIRIGHGRSSKVLVTHAYIVTIEDLIHINSYHPPTLVKQPKDEFLKKYLYK